MWVPSLTFPKVPSPIVRPSAESELTKHVVAYRARTALWGFGFNGEWCRWHVAGGGSHRTRRLVPGSVGRGTRARLTACWLALHDFLVLHYFEIIVKLFIHQTMPSILSQLAPDRPHPASRFQPPISPFLRPFPSLAHQARSSSILPLQPPLLQTARAWAWSRAGLLRHSEESRVASAWQELSLQKVQFAL